MSYKLQFAILLVAALVLASCGADVDPGANTVETSVRPQSLGEPVGEYPSLSERRLLYLTNRAKTEPDAFNPNDPYPPTPPLRWDLALSEAARFHARHIVEASCWCEDHSSCCNLGDSGGEVACQSAVTGCGATSPEDRVRMWSSAYSGENMARGQMSAGQAMAGWIDSPGHWANINGGHGLLGPGNYQAAWVQDFGSGGGAPPVIGDGIHFSEGQGLRFGITYYQPNTGGPQDALAIVDGECHEMELAYGAPDHGAFETSLNVGSGCHRYYFHFRDGDGADHVYPSEGSFGAAIGTTDACPFYSEDKPADTCSPSGQTCETGHTRFCYTGPFGTRNVGKCEEGVERCIGGQWTGECRGDIHPDDDETCGNDVDDNCDGEVDEGCPAAMPDAGASNTGGLDVGNVGQVTEEPPVDEGCATTPPAGAPVPWWMTLALGGIGLLRSRRRD